MTVRQLSIFLENRVGRLAEITKILGDGGIDILAISIADTADFGILRLLVDDVDKAVSILSEHGVVCRLDAIAVISVEGVPGGLARVLQTIHESGVNVEYMYTVSQTKYPNPLMVIKFSDFEKANKAIQETGLKQLGAEEIF
ncbi:MAG: amino acid-binding protein [Lentisphaeria bacterium]|nr:amino acid-binding protein [Lentisphaeria bacterium]